MVKLDFEKSSDGLIPAIAQDYLTNEILMMAYINQEAWEYTLATNNATYYSRSRKKLWKKGETSGNVQKIKEILVDCDDDTVIFRVEQIGGVACHTGHKSCFFRKLDINNELAEISEVLIAPEELYKK